MRHAPDITTSVLPPGATQTTARRAQWMKGRATILPALMMGLLAILPPLWLSADSKAPLEIDFDALKTAASKQNPAQSTRVITQWQELIKTAETQPANVRLTQINHFFHRQLTYRDDNAVWGQSDYWATPLQTLMQGQGDCEDYAIGTYVSLLQAGIPN